MINLRQFLSLFFSFLLLVSFASAEIYDDFSSGSLDLDLWTLTTSLDIWLEIDEYWIDGTEQNYHTAQLDVPGSDKGIILSLTREFVNGEALSYNVNYRSSTGNILSRLYVNEQYLDEMGLDHHGYPTSGNIGYWGGYSESGDMLGLYHVSIYFGDESITVIIENPDGDIWEETVSASSPYTFGVATRTGHDGYGEFDYDNFEITLAEDPVEEVDLESRVLVLEELVLEQQEQLDAYEERISTLEDTVSLIMDRLRALWRIIS